MTTRPGALVVLSLILSVTAAAGAVVAVLIATGLLGGGAPSSSTSFEAQMRSYILENPEVLIESVQLLEEQRQTSEVNELQAFIAANAGEIFNSEGSPTVGNPQGDVTIVEFFDYNCPYCRKAEPLLTEAAQADGGLRVVLKEWPILGPGSVAAARVALAADAQGEYEALHKALMAHSGRIDEAVALELAETVGIDVERLKRDIRSPNVAAEIDRNMALAGDLRITGTPSFVVGDEIVRGLVDLATLQRYIADARAATDRGTE